MRDALKQEFFSYDVVEFWGTGPILAQLKTFATASLIVAPHGAGLSNMVVSPLHTPVLEIGPLGCSACYVHLAMKVTSDPTAFGPWFASVVPLSMRFVFFAQVLVVSPMEVARTMLLTYVMSFRRGKLMGSPRLLAHCNNFSRAGWWNKIYLDDKYHRGRSLLPSCKPPQLQRQLQHIYARHPAGNAWDIPCDSEYEPNVDEILRLAR